MKAIQIATPGGPDVLQLREVESPSPGEGEALVEIRAVGVNFIDVYHRTGLYPVQPPFTPGMEAAGVVSSVGPGVYDVAKGDRVAYAMHLGAYAQEAVVPAWKLVKISSEVELETAAGVMLQGLTAHYLSRSTFALRPGHTALVHAAAGGVGQLLVQMCKIAGATVFGTVSTEGKAALARQAGADAVILYSQQDFESETMRLTDGKGVHVVYDSVGKNTFDKSLRCLKPRGMLALFGQSSGPVPPIDPQILNQRGSVFLTRPSLAHYAASREELIQRANDIFAWIGEGRLNVCIDRAYPLAEASKAHAALEARETSGKVLLLTG